MSTPPDLEDLDGNPVSLASARGRVVALVFGSQSTAEPTANALRALGRALLPLPGTELWAVISAPRMLKGMAVPMLKAVRTQGLDSARKHLGAAAPADLDSRFRMLGDWDGRLTKAMAPAREATVLLLDRQGEVIGRWVGAEPAVLASEAALAARQAAG